MAFVRTCKAGTVRVHNDGLAIGTPAVMYAVFPYLLPPRSRTIPACGSSRPPTRVCVWPVNAPGHIECKQSGVLFQSSGED